MNNFKERNQVGTDGMEHDIRHAFYIIFVQLGA